MPISTTSTPTTARALAFRGALRGVLGGGGGVSRRAANQAAQKAAERAHAVSQGLRLTTDRGLGLGFEVLCVWYESPRRSVAGVAVIAPIVTSRVPYVRVPP